MDPMAYLARYGYLDQVAPRNPGVSYLTQHAGELRSAIQEFQGGNPIGFFGPKMALILARKPARSAT